MNLNISVLVAGRVQRVNAGHADLIRRLGSRFCKRRLQRAAALRGRADDSVACLMQVLIVGARVEHDSRRAQRVQGSVAPRRSKDSSEAGQTSQAGSHTLDQTTHDAIVSAVRLVA